MSFESCCFPKKKLLLSKLLLSLKLFIFLFFFSFLAFDVYGSVNNGSPKKLILKAQKCYVS